MIQTSIRRPIAVALVGISLSLAGATTLATDTRPPSTQRDYWARLTPTQEVPAVSSVARGSIKLSVDTATQTITYELEFSGLEGNVSQAHIHTAQAGVNGGVMVWLCGTGTFPAPLAGPAGTPVCPANGGTVTGTITAAQIQTVTAQGIAGPTEFAEVARAIANFVAYANVHSSKFPGGEIRGQIVRRWGRPDNDD